jgi:hypothetical protein
MNGKAQSGMREGAWENTSTNLKYVAFRCFAYGIFENAAAVVAASAQA